MISLKKRILVDKICSNPLRTAKEWIISKEFVDLEAVSVQINIILKKNSKVVNLLFFPIAIKHYIQMTLRSCTHQIMVTFTP